MKILVDINHPAHVHLFRNAISEWRQKGYEVRLAAREKDITLELLDHYGLEYERTATGTGRSRGLASGVVALDRKILALARDFDSDWLIGTSFAIAHVSKLVRGRSIVFGEDDFGSSSLFWLITSPFADYVATPDTIPGRLGRRHLRYRGCHELAYLHPNRFVADKAELAAYGIALGERYFLVRFVSLQASHDRGQRGISSAIQQELVSQLTPHGRVLITSEGGLPDDLEPYRLRVAPHKIHHLLAFAELFVGDSQTMAIEAGILGTPSVRYNSFVGRTPVIEDLEHTYGLTRGFKPDQGAEMLTFIERAVNDRQTKREWLRKRDEYIRTQIDLTDWIVNLPERLS